MTNRSNPIIDGYFVSSLAATLAAIGVALGLIFLLSYAFYWAPLVIAAAVFIFFAWYYRLGDAISRVAARHHAPQGKTGNERP